MKFSVTIPAYKKKYLSEAIESVLAQTCQDWELIIVNDASPEDLDSIISVLNDPRIRYYKNEKNVGAVNVVDNWNKCLEYATGDYIICMGDDDKLLPCCLEEYLKLIKKHPGLGVYHAWTEIIDENSNFLEMTAVRGEFESVYSLIWHRWVSDRQQFIGDFLFDTQQLRKNGGFYKSPLAWASDDISVVIAATSKGIANTQNICFCYRNNPHTITNTGNIPLKLQAIQHESEWYNSFLKTEPHTEFDVKYWQNINERKERYFEKKKGLTLAEDMKHNTVLRALYWLVNRKKYKLSIESILYAIIQTFK